MATSFISGAEVYSFPSFDILGINNIREFNYPVMYICEDVYDFPLAY